MFEFKGYRANWLALYELVHNPEYCHLKWDEHVYEIYLHGQIVVRFGNFSYDLESNYVAIWHKGERYCVNIPNAPEVCRKVLKGERPLRWLKRLVLKRKKNEDKRRFS